MLITYCTTCHARPIAGMLCDDRGQPVCARCYAGDFTTLDPYPPEQAPLYDRALISRAAAAGALEEQEAITLAGRLR